jgi:uncharacterized metal-binding protein YceD (DUF177 family)
MMPDKSFIIQLSKLKEGLNEISVEVKKETLDALDHSYLVDVDAKADIVFEKREWTHRMHVKIYGKVKLPCDRCTENIFIPISGAYQLVVKQVEKVPDSDDEVLFIHLSDNEIDLKPIVYDFIMTSVPMKVTCEIPEAEKKCDDDALKIIEQLSHPENNEPVPDERWSKLKDKLK